MVDNAQADDADEGMHGVPREAGASMADEVAAPAGSQRFTASWRPSRRSGTRRTRGSGRARSSRTSARGWRRSRSASTCTEAHRPSGVDRHGRGGRVRPDRVLRPARRRARRPLPAQVAADHHQRSSRPRSPRCSPCSSSSATRRPDQPHADRASATASRPRSASPRSRRSSPTSCPSRTSRARSRCRRRSTTSGASSAPSLAGVVIGARRLRVGGGDQRRQLPRRRRGAADPDASGARGRRAAPRRSSRSIVDGFRFVRREPGLRVNVARDVRQHLPRGAVHRARPGDGDRRCSDGARAARRCWSPRRASARSLMAFSLGSLVERFRPRRVLVSLMGALPFALVAYAVRARRSPLSALDAARRRARSTSARCRASRRSRSCARRPKLRGRVLAVHTVILGSLYPLGAVVQGKIADPIGLRATTVRGGGRDAGDVAASCRGCVRPGITARDRRAGRVGSISMTENTDVVLFERRGNIALAHAEPARGAQRDQPRGQPDDGRRPRRDRGRRRRCAPWCSPGAGEVFSRGRRPQGRRPGPRQRHRARQGRLRRHRRRATSRSRSSPR